VRKHPEGAGPRLALGERRNQPTTVVPSSGASLRTASSMWSVSAMALVGLVLRAPVHEKDARKWGENGQYFTVPSEGAVGQDRRKAFELKEVP